MPMRGGVSHNRGILRPRMQLRRDVGVVRSAQGVSLIDHLTGLRFTIPGSFQASQSQPDVEVWEELDSLGLCDGELSLDEVRRRQSHLARHQGDAELWSAVQGMAAHALDKVP